MHKVDGNGVMETIQDKFSMEQDMMQSNETKLHLANESPLQLGDLAEVVMEHDYNRWEQYFSMELWSFMTRWRKESGNI